MPRTPLATATATAPAPTAHELRRRAADFAHESETDSLPALMAAILLTAIACPAIALAPILIPLVTR